MQRLDVNHDKFTYMHSQARRGDAESPPQSALEFLRASVGAVQAGGGSRRSQFEREVEALRLWSAEADRG